MNRQSRCQSFRKPKTNPRNGWRKGKYSLTEVEKMTIKAARKADWSYRRISIALCRPHHTIQRFCKREGLIIKVSEKLLKAAKTRNAALRKPLAKCQWCGKEYKSRPDARSPCCGKLCSGAWRSYQNKGAMYCLLHVCVDCGRRTEIKQMRCFQCMAIHELTWRKEWEKTHKYFHPKDCSPRKCKECSKMFIPEYGNKHRTFCSIKCGRKYGRRIARASRRARIRILRHENIDPLAIFKRDKWQCQLCGIKTPKNLRGTCVPHAPELDHMIPLSQGGTHTWNNVQCLCRQCNQEKGARIMGQLRLAI